MGLLDSAGAYLAANPDVAAEATRIGWDPATYAAHHYASSGASEGRSWGADNVAGNQVTNSLSNYTADTGSAAGAYLSSYKDIADWANQQVAAGQFKDANEAANWHYNNSGRSENRVFGVNLGGVQQSAILDNRQDVLDATKNGLNVNNWFNTSGWNEGTATTLDNLNYSAQAKTNANQYLANNGIKSGNAYDAVRDKGGTWGTATSLTLDPTTGKYSDGNGNVYDNASADAIYYAQNKDKIDKSGLSPQEYFQNIGKYAGDSYGVNVQTLKKAPTAAASQAYPFNFDSQVQAPTETIEGRIKNLLDQNNPVIRQAGERATAQFAQRGLLNSSMAIEAANEAMISKAIEIAGPDAQTYFQNRTNNVNWQNKAATAEQQQGYDLQKMDYANSLTKDTAQSNQSLQMQTNYQTAIQNIDQQYKQQMLALQQNNNLDPTAKQSALDDLVTVRDNSIRLMTATFSQFPQWQSDWSKLVAMLPTA